MFCCDRKKNEYYFFNLISPTVVLTYHNTKTNFETINNVFNIIIFYF